MEGASPRASSCTCFASSTPVSPHTHRSNLGATCRRRRAADVPRCELNLDGDPTTGDFPVPEKLVIGDLCVPTPVVLAPMAGVTSYPFRRLCQRFGAGLYVSEMVHARVVAEGRADGRARFGAHEYPRSAQLYGTDPGSMRAAAERLVHDQRVDLIDLNFGCPAPKVLRKGGGAAIADDTELLGNIVRAVVDVARPAGVPVTAKMRLGLRWDSLNYAEAGRAAEAAGASAVTLHARTAADMYEEGTARRSWPHIRALAHVLGIPVLANGDIFTAADALRVVRRTGAAGVSIGRGCLGRPWLFEDLAEGFRTRWAAQVTVPDFRVVSSTLLEHVDAEVAWQGLAGVEERSAIAHMRKWFSWYLHGYNGLPALFVPRLQKSTSVEMLREIMSEADPARVSYNYDIVVGSRGKYSCEKVAEREPPMPKPPKKSGSQRLPKTEKGILAREARLAEADAERDAQRTRVKEWRRRRALPRRRSRAESVKQEESRQTDPDRVKKRTVINPRGNAEGLSLEMVGDGGMGKGDGSASGG